MKIQKHVIYVPGLSDTSWLNMWQRLLMPLPWRRFGLRAHYFKVAWATQDETFQAKLERLLQLIDKLHSQGHEVSLISASAGASLALVAFSERKTTVHRTVTICGKLQNPQAVGEEYFVISPAFRQSLERFQVAQMAFSPEDRARIITVQPKSDNIIPLPDMLIAGAILVKIPTHGHLLSIIAAITIYAHRIVRHII